MREPSFEAERTIALGELDVFPFVLAEKLGKTVAELDAMPHLEYVQWRALWVYRDAIATMRAQRAKNLNGLPG